MAISADSSPARCRSEVTFPAYGCGSRSPSSHADPATPKMSVQITGTPSLASTPWTWSLQLVRSCTSLCRYAEARIMPGCWLVFRWRVVAGWETDGSAARQVHLMAHVSRWLAGQDLEPADLGGCVVERFVAARRADGYTKYLSARALAPMLGYLRGLDVMAEPVPPEPRTPADELVGRFGEYLARERCLAVESIRSYLGVARRFMADAAIGDRGAGDLTAAVVTGFVGRECGRRGVASAKATVRGLRSLLRFLYLDGQITEPLAGAVPSAASWQLAELPRTG